MTKKQKLIGGALFFIIVFGGIIFFLNRNGKSDGEDLVENYEQENYSNKFSQKGFEEKESRGFFQEENCKSNSNPVFTYPMTDLSKIQAIGKLGGFGGGSPGRSYLTIKKEIKEVPVYAPMDAVLETIIYAPRGPEAPPEYGFYFKASCEVSFLLDHVDKISDEIKNLAPQEPAESTRTELGSNPNELIKAGTLLGYSDGTPLGRTFDFLASSNVKPAFHINEDRWEWDQAVYSVCPYDFYQGELKEQFYAKIETSTQDGFLPEAECGSPSQDIPGTASGGWFMGSSTDSRGDYLALGQDASGIEVFFRKNGQIVFGFRHYLAFSKVKKPEEIKPGEQVCYTNNNYWTWISLESDNKLLTVKGSGSCPKAFPVSEAEVWER